VTSNPRRIPLWKWGIGLWILGVIVYFLLILYGSGSWLEGQYESASWLITGFVLASIGVQSLRFPILPWFYGLSREKASWRIGISSYVGVGLFTYFFVSLLNAFGRCEQFGTPLASSQASGLIYGQIMLPNGYEFGLPDIFISLILAAIIDTALFLPLVRRRKAAALFGKSLLLVLCLFPGTIIATLEAAVVLSYIVVFTGFLFRTIGGLFS